MGPIVRVGDQVVWVTVNPAIENQRDVAIRLARTAIGNL
jgi:mannose/fructose/N-acetylgalactosamine-specific phosphotransferase system component IID